MSLEQILGVAGLVLCAASFAAIVNFVAMQRERKLEKRLGKAEDMLMYTHTYPSALLNMARDIGNTAAELHYSSKIEERREEMDAWWNTRAVEFSRKVAEEAIAAQREEDRKRGIAQDVWRHLAKEEGPLANEVWELIVGKKP